MPWVRDVKIETKAPDAIIHLLVEQGKYSEAEAKAAIAKTKFTWVGAP